MPKGAVTSMAPTMKSNERSAVIRHHADHGDAVVDRLVDQVDLTLDEQLLFFSVT